MTRRRKVDAMNNRIEWYLYLTSNNDCTMPVKESEGESNIRVIKQYYEEGSPLPEYVLQRLRAIRRRCMADGLDVSSATYIAFQHMWQEQTWYPIPEGYFEE